MASSSAPSTSAWSLVTPMLLYSAFCLLVGDMLFGYDTGSFGGVLANPGFVNQFGVFNPSTDKWAFDSLHTSLLSSLPFIGKFLGCLVAGPAIEWIGHRGVFFALSVVSFVGIIIEITAAGTSVGSGRLAQFIVGRTIVYISVGLVEVDVTLYQSEIVPAAFRGLVVVSLQLFLNAGSIVATGVNKAFSTTTDSLGWKVVTGIQFVYPVLIILFTFFIPSSPRWLISKDRDDEAIQAIRRLRPKGPGSEAACAAEIHAIREALQEHVHKAPWFDLLRGSNFRRTMIVMVYYFFQQTTGQAFVSTYQTTFYKTNGYADQAFTYPVISYCLSFLSVIPAMYMIDRIGRRYSLMITFSFQAFWIFLLAGLGGMAHKTASEKNMIVAAFMLYAFSYNMGGASIPYLLGSEIPNAALREKTQGVGTAWNVVWAFVTNFVIPYMINNIHFGVGWVFGGIALLAFCFTFFFLPETKGRALEEIDAIFAVANNPFRRTEIHYTDAERRIGQLEGEKQVRASVSEHNDSLSHNMHKEDS
ncbi:sugar transporter [Cladophialophora carrionii]|uniref:Sugar transporter n=1 Tax=Cladophialophora carrionii TaxID=86049 RepID=A0A1C1CXM6_9EURO|nr:sugar transporter [Cladophialophora carrionii]